MRHRSIVIVCFFLTASLFAQVPTEAPSLPPGPELQEPVVPEVVPEDVPDDVAPHPTDAEGRQGAVRGEGAADEGADLVLRTPNGTEHMRITAAGNVGIGTSTPAQKFEIFNGTTTDGAVVISTPLATSFPVNTAIGGLRMSWKYGGSLPNNVDFKVVRGLDSVDGAGLAIFTSPSNTSTVERMRITSAGRVGIGYNAPWSKLTVDNTETGVAAFITQQRSSFSANTYSTDRGGMSLMYTTVSAGVTNSGVAIGHSGASQLFGTGTLAYAYGLNGNTSVFPGQTGTITNGYGVFATVKKNDGSIGTGYGVYVDDVTATTDYAFYQVGQDDSNYFGGDITVGASGAAGTKLTVNGNVNVNGSITGASVIGATYQDLAEWVPASSDMEPGTVVVLNHDRTNEVMRSSRAYDTSVAGVVSAQPGIILGVGSDSKEQIATTGRVKVRVDATHGPVRVGDLLVTSDKPGYAMKSIPVDIAGISMHRPGTIVGKALEALASGEGEILVLLSLQ